MPMYKSFCCKEIGRSGEGVSKEEEGPRNSTDDHHTQILREESMVRYFTNMIFFFAGDTSMQYLLMKLQIAILVHCTQSVKSWACSRGLPSFCFSFYAHLVPWTSKNGNKRFMVDLLLNVFKIHIQRKKPATRGINKRMEIITSCIHETTQQSSDIELQHTSLAVKKHCIYWYKAEGQARNSTTSKGTTYVTGVIHNIIETNTLSVSLTWHSHMTELGSNGVTKFECNASLIRQGNNLCLFWAVANQQQLQIQHKHK